MNANLGEGVIARVAEIVARQQAAGEERGAARRGDMLIQIMRDRFRAGAGAGARAGAGAGAGA